MAFVPFFCTHCTIYIRKYYTVFELVCACALCLLNETNNKRRKSLVELKERKQTNNNTTATRDSCVKETEEEKNNNKQISTRINVHLHIFCLRVLFDDRLAVFSLM